MCAGPGVLALSLALQQCSVDLLEGRPLLGVPPPTIQHDLIHRVRTQHWLGKVDLAFLVPEELASVLYDLFVSQLGVRLLVTEGQGLPQRHPKCPHVTGCGELSQQYALPGHPSYRQHGPALDAVVVSAVQVPAHAKVSDLDGVVLPHQTVPRGQVSVDKVERGEVPHP